MNVIGQNIIGMVFHRIIFIIVFQGYFSGRGSSAEPGGFFCCKRKLRNDEKKIAELRCGGYQNDLFYLTSLLIFAKSHRLEKLKKKKSTRLSRSS
jgi:hypothetical protein